MYLNDYQDATRNTAIYPGVGTGSYEAVSYCALGLGEAGEIQGKVKKIARDNNGEISEDRKEEIYKEMGDLLWYVARLADEIGYPLSNVAEANLAKINSRSTRGVIGGSGDNR